MWGGFRVLVEGFENLLMLLNWELKIVYKFSKFWVDMYFIEIKLKVFKDYSVGLFSLF